MKYQQHQIIYKPFILIYLSTILLLSCTSEKVDYVALQKNLMDQGFGINKVFYIVDDLEETRDYFADTLGFSLPSAKRFRQSNFDGVLQTNTRFPDQSSIEFMMINSDSVSDNTPQEWVRFSENFEGVQSYSLSTSNIEKTGDWLQKRGLQWTRFNLTERLKAHLKDGLEMMEKHKKVPCDLQTKKNICQSSCNNLPPITLK